MKFLNNLKEQINYIYNIDFKLGFLRKVLKSMIDLKIIIDYKKMKNLTLKDYANILIIKECLEQLKSIRNQVLTEYKVNLIKELMYKITIAGSNLSELKLNNLDEINKLLNIDVKYNIKIKEEKNNLKMNNVKDTIYISDDDSFIDLTNKNFQKDKEIIGINDNISYSSENSDNCNILYEESVQSQISSIKNDEENIEFEELSSFYNIEKYHTRRGRVTNKVNYYV